MRVYMRTGRRTGVSVGLFGAIVLGFFYLLALLFAAMVAAAVFLVALFVKGLSAVGHRRQPDVEVIPPPPGSTRPQAHHSDRR
jgi:hypothetical protein